MINQKLLDLLTKVSYYNGKLETIKRVDKALTELNGQYLPATSKEDGIPSYAPHQEIVIERYQKDGFDAKDEGLLATVNTEIENIDSNEVNQTKRENIDTINTYFFIGLIAKLEDMLNNPKSYPEIKWYAEAKLNDLKRNNDLRDMISTQLGFANDETLDEKIDALISEIEKQTMSIQLKHQSEKQGFADSSYIPGEKDEYSDVFNPDFDKMQELNDLLGLGKTPSVKGKCI